jgi:site-specific recombinase XerD
MLRAGKSLKAVQLLMGHSDAATTLRHYAHLLPNDLEQAVEL